MSKNVDKLKSNGKHEGCIRGFKQLSKSWYGPANLQGSNVLDRITIGFYSANDGTSGEFQVVWERLAQEWVPRLKAYDDSWSALFGFSDLLESMAKVDDKGITPDEFVMMLEGLGIENMTETMEAGGD